MIELHGFGKDYGEFTAVESLDLKINEGEMFGFIGPNGAGKSTSIRFLATLLRASRGDGTINGFSVSKQPMDVRRSVGYMPDAFGVYDGMKVWEFLDFFAVAYKIGRTQRKQIIRDVLELLDLTYKRDDYVNGLSRGMKQRLCLAKTLVHDPPVLILDEPASGLDPRARVEVKALLKELRKMGKTILISSHILSELADCCTSIGIIERGKLLMHGPMEEVYQRIRGNQVIQARFGNRFEQALAIIRSNPDVSDVQVEGQKVLIEFISPETLPHDDASAEQLSHQNSARDQNAARLLKQLVDNQVEVIHFGTKEPNLEEVFMMVTKGLVN